MKGLLGKVNTAVQRSRLKKEALKLYRSADAIYWHEMEKSRTERDQSLMAECLATMEQSSAIMFGGTNRSRTSPVCELRKAVAVCCAILALGAVSTGVAYAKVSELWHFEFHSTNKGITLAGNANTYAEGESDIIDFASVENTSGEECATIEAAVQKLGINPLNLDLTKHGMMVDNIYIIKNDTMMEFSVTYIGTDIHADYVVQVYNGAANTAFVTEILGEYDKTQVYTVNSIDIQTGYSNDECALCWASNGYVYQVITNIDADTVLSLIKQSMEAE